MTEQPVFSARDNVEIVCEGSGNSYLIAPLTYRERVAFRSDMAREGGIFPNRNTLLTAMRSAIEVISPGNAAELLSMIDRAEANPGDAALQVQLLGLETACSIVPTYADLLGARERYMGILPWVACRHALRGWSGLSVQGSPFPAFQQVRGVVPEDLMALIPEDDMRAVGFAANRLMTPQADAEGNSGSRSRSPASHSPATVASSRKTAGSGRSRARNTKRTRA